MYLDIRQRAFEPAYFYKNLKKIQDLDDQTFPLQLVTNEISILPSIVGRDILPKQKFHRPYYFSSKSLTYVYLPASFYAASSKEREKTKLWRTLRK